MYQFSLIIPQRKGFIHQYFQADKNLIGTKVMDLRLQNKTEILCFKENVTRKNTQRPSSI